jgi:AraC-like DNA-binding protein
MDNSYTTSTPQPTIVKFAQAYRAGIQSQHYNRYGIGFVLRGRKRIYHGDFMQEINRGDLFYLSTGNHYTEDIPDDNKPFEQIVFYYRSDELGSALAHLNLDFGLNFENDHSCPECEGKNHVVCKGWNSIRDFFMGVNSYIKDGIFNRDDIAERIKMIELLYLIIMQPDCCLKNKLLNNNDATRENFEQMISRNIFTDKSIGELAHECNRSLTSFKKEFRKHFFEPPHRWFIKQRLIQARLLLISSEKSISEVGNECLFPNTSHFIKLFRKEYGMTPANYRNKHSGRDKVLKKTVRV